MFINTVYNKIKERLAPVGAPVFFYIGQYQPGNDNTSYKVPAIYIEMPADTPLVTTKKIMKSAGVMIKIHYISYAPFKNQSNDVQETAITDHETALKQIDNLLSGWNAKQGTINITEQLLPRTSQLMKFQGMSLISVIGYKTDLYSLHQTG